MKLASTATTYFVEHAGCRYRTTDGKHWERLMGESWGPAWPEEDALSKIFTSQYGDMLAKQNAVYQSLAALYKQYHHHDDYDSFWKAVRELMHAYDEWLE